MNALNRRSKHEDYPFGAWVVRGDRSLRPPGYWEERAKKFQEAFEAKSYLVTVPTKLLRGVVCRFTHLRSKEVEESIYLGVRPGNNLYSHLMAREYRNVRTQRLQLARVWLVVSITNIHDETDYEIHSRWDNLPMAKAHVAGRNFHYAKFLMTKEEKP